jgi:hypothetical protein
MAKVPLTLAQHRSIGAQLYDMRTQLVCLSVWIGNTYRRERMALAVHAEQRIDRVRSRLDHYLAVEYPALPYLDFCHVYYPGPTRFQESWREWNVIKARQAAIIMTRDARVIADKLFKAYPVALGDRLLLASESIEAISINMPDWPVKRGRWTSRPTQ